MIGCMTPILQPSPRTVSPNSRVAPNRTRHAGRIELSHLDPRAAGQLEVIPDDGPQVSLRSYPEWARHHDASRPLKAENCASASRLRQLNPILVIAVPIDIQRRRNSVLVIGESIVKTLTILVSSVLVLVATSGLVNASPDKVQIAPPRDYKNIRLGLWEMTDERTTQGGPKIDMAQIQAHLADDMKGTTPEQRARIEAVMKKQAAQAAGAPTSRTKQKCITAADRDKNLTNDMKERDSAELNCTMKEVCRTSSKVVVDMSCSGRDRGQIAKAEGRGEGPIVMTQNGTMTFEFKSPTEMESQFQMSALIGNEPMKSDMKMHGRWISAECGKVK